MIGYLFVLVAMLGGGQETTQQPATPKGRVEELWGGIKPLSEAERAKYKAVEWDAYNWNRERANEQYEHLQRIRCFPFELHTDDELDSESRRSVRTAVELRLRELGLPLEDTDALQAKQRARTQELERNPKWVAAGRPSDDEVMRLWLRQVDCLDRLVKLSISLFPFESDTRYAYQVALDFITEATVPQRKGLTTHYWEVDTSVWHGAYLGVCGRDHLEVSLRRTSLKLVDAFANDFLKANPKGEQKKGEPKKGDGK